MAQSQANGGQTTISQALESTQIGEKQIDSLGKQYPTEAALVSGFREGDNLGEISGIGGITVNRVFGWMQESHNGAWRERLENSEAYCTEFKSEVDIPEEKREDNTTYFTFVCPRCSSGNPLKGDPSGFRNRPFACLNCKWVSCLLAEYLDDFIEEENFTLDLEEQE